MLVLIDVVFYFGLCFSLSEKSRNNNKFNFFLIEVLIFIRKIEKKQTNFIYLRIFC